MTALARGIDVSSWQHPAQAPIDWEAVAEAGITFAIIKATQGVDYVNPWFEKDYSDAFAAGLLVGAYHLYVAGADPAEQARLFVTTLMGKRLDVHAWLDFEVAPTSNWTAAGWVNAFFDATRDARPGMGLYVDRSWWTELQAANVEPPALWLAAPDATEAPPGATIWQSRPGEVAGVPGEVDIDYLSRPRAINLPTAPAQSPAHHVEPTTSVVDPDRDEPPARADDDNCQD